MKFFHSTVIPTQRILDCLPLSQQGNSSNVLLIYRDIAKYVQIDKIEFNKVQTTDIAKYPLDSRIVSTFVVGEHLLCFTADGYLLYTQSSPPFERISIHELSEGVAPYTIPIAYTVASQNKEYIISCAFWLNLVIIKFDENENIVITHRNLPEFIVHGITPTHQPEVFAFLVAEHYSNKKYILLYNVSDLQEVTHFEIDCSAYSISTIFAEGTSFIVIFANKKVIVIDNNRQSFETEIDKKMISSIQAPTGDYIFQVEDGSMYGLVFNGDSVELIQKGRMPLINKFVFMQNELLFCVIENSDSLILPFDSGYSLQNSLGFDDFPKKAYSATVRITNSLIRDREMILTAGSGQNSRIIKIKNCLPSSQKKIEEATQQFRANALYQSEKVGMPNDEVKLLSFPNKSLVASTENRTTVLRGTITCSLSPTIACGHFGKNDFLQITNSLILGLISGFEWQPKCPIKKAALTESLCIVFLSNDHFVAFDQSLNQIAEKEILHVLDFVICDEMIAVITEPTIGGNSTVNLYFQNLLPADGVIQLTSCPVSMLYVASSNELLISIKSHQVIRCNLDLLSQSIIYQGTKDAVLLPFLDSALIIGEKTYLYDSTEIQSIGIDNPISVCIGFKSNKLFVLDKDKQIIKVTILDNTKDLTTEQIDIISTPRRILSINETLMVTCRDANSGNSVRILNENTDSQTDLDNYAPMSILHIPGNNPTVFLGSMTNSENGKLSLLVYDPQADSLHQLHSINTKAPPYAMARVDTSIIVGLGRRLFTLKLEDQGWVLSEDPIASLPTQIAFIDVGNLFVWVGDRTQSVFCFIVCKNDGDIRVKPLAIDTQPRQLTAMKCIDDYTVVVGDRFGTITFLRLPDDIIAHVPWKVSQPPERGVYMPPTGHLSRIASFNVHETITSILTSPHSDAIYYTTIFGQIGALIPSTNEEEYGHIANAEAVIKKCAANEFGLNHQKRLDSGYMSIVSIDIFEYLDQFCQTTQTQIEETLKTSRQSLNGLCCRLKTAAKF